MRARFAEEIGELEEVERSFQWVLRLDRDGPWSWWHWGEFLERQLRHADAVEAFEKSLAADPAFLPAHRSLGLIYASAGEDDKAAHHLEAALGMSGSDRPFEVLSRLYQRAGDTRALGRLVQGWALEEDLDVDGRLARAQAALAARQSSLVFDVLLEDALDVRSPLWINLLVQSGRDACRLWDVGEVLKQVDAAEDAQLRGSWQAWQGLAGDASATPSDLRSLAPLLLRLLEQQRPHEALSLLERYSAQHGSSQAVSLMQSLVLSRLGRPEQALEMLNGIDDTRVLPVMDRRFTDELRAPLVDQARALRSHLQLELGGADQDSFEGLGASDRRAVRNGGPPGESLSPRVRTALLLDADRREEAIAAAQSADARRLLPGAPTANRLADEPGCDSRELMARAEVADSCEALDLLIRARNAGPFVPGIKDALATSRRACETLVPSEVP